jgi:hypothetical protein
MGRKPKSHPAAESSRADARRETYRKHEIIFPADEQRKRIYIDGRPVRYGQAGDQFYLDVYAYDRGKSLKDVIKRYLDYRDGIRVAAEKK